MEVGPGVDSVKLNQYDITVIRQNEEPYIKESEEERLTDGPNKSFNDSQESLEGRGLDDKAELVKENLAGFLSTIIIASNTPRCIMVVIILLLCI
ncbi:hypothetical protein X943_000293 [Babesia divergens]|uniref:Uncharacterized protein n=1 Tax=Babesia divergens TaxID=32595 RepID=A0AAD9LKI8_BABDI|nr:hypothetical protein X943_000293 [Babesia divergens]